MRGFSLPPVTGYPHFVSVRCRLRWRNHGCLQAAARQSYGYLHRRERRYRHRSGRHCASTLRVTESAPRRARAPEVGSNSAALVDAGRGLVLTILGEPFRRRAWSELGFFLISGFVGVIAAVFVIAGVGIGVILAVVVVGLPLIAGSLRTAREVGCWHRSVALRMLGERIPAPEPFSHRRGFVYWVGASLRDGAAWRALAYSFAKIPIFIFGIWFALSVWIEALLCLLYGISGGHGGPHGFGPFQLGIGQQAPGPTGVFHPEAIILYGALLLFVAPWPMRLVVFVDRQLMHLLLGPDPMTARVRSLEESRAQTVDASAATLRRIERDLHDGTQAQLVALAMQLGQAKEELAKEDHPDIRQIRLLVEQAHRGAKEAIVELRDLARGIHPPVLDTGLESALSTLTARAAVPTGLAVSLQSRPTPAIEAIAYFCVAELLANVAQHAQASRASVSCAQHGPWLRLVVRDDGRGGATINGAGSSSSGLAGLIDRVRAVDGHLSLASPPGGPTAITVDLPCHA
jgi:signal transduction histidine kinase